MRHTAVISTGPTPRREMARQDHRRVTRQDHRRVARQDHRRVARQDHRREAPHPDRPPSPRTAQMWCHRCGVTCATVVASGPPLDEKTTTTVALQLERLERYVTKPLHTVTYRCAAAEASRALRY